MEHKNAYKTKLKNKISYFFTKEPQRSFSATDVLDELKAMGESANITSIYRNLEAMTEDGILMKFQDVNCERALYQYAGEGGGCHTHLHIKCVSCGKTSHLDCHFMHELEEHAFLGHGFKLMCDRSMLYGKCSDCLMLEEGDE